MSYQPYTVTVAATGTLIWQTSTGVSPDTAVAPSSYIFRAGTPQDPVPIQVVIPSGTTLAIVGSAGAAVNTGVSIAGPTVLTYNVVGNDIMYGAITGTGTVQLIVGRQ
jgi:hypothetical protein